MGKEIEFRTSYTKRKIGTSDEMETASTTSLHKICFRIFNDAPKSARKIVILYDVIVKHPVQNGISVIVKHLSLHAEIQCCFPKWKINSPKLLENNNLWLSQSVHGLSFIFSFSQNNVCFKWQHYNESHGHCSGIQNQHCFLLLQRFGCICGRIFFHQKRKHFLNVILRMRDYFLSHSLSLCVRRAYVAACRISIFWCITVCIDFLPQKRIL